MAELNLKQITDKLNAEFSGDTRKLVFWYDDKAEFAEDIDTLELVNAQVYHLEPDNQFYTKYFLERQDRTTNYLIYAPFPRPNVRDNHLEDTLLYSRQFFADRASLLTVDLGLDEQYKPVMQKYIKFFRAKNRTQRFYDLEIDHFTKETIEVGLMSVLCKTRTSSFEEVLRVVLMDDGFEDNKFLAEFEKYDLLPAFWSYCEEQFGYTDVQPTLEKLAVTMFVTYTERYLHDDLPPAWKSFVSYKSGNIIAFLDNLMNNVLYRDKYNEISAYVSKGLNATTVFETYQPEALIDCDTFAVLDNFIIHWVNDRLLNEDIGARLADLTIPAVCQERRKKHFGAGYQIQYWLLEHAYYLISAADYHSQDSFKGIVEQYLARDCLIDTHYRKFYYYYDQLSENILFEKLRDLVENIYSNEYLSEVISKWNSYLVREDILTVISLQRNFYNQHVLYSKDRVVVIISDALRYEVGRSLWLKLQDDEKCNAKLAAMLSVLPSNTRFGMAALLPHKTLAMTDDYQVLVDGMPCNDLKQREAILKSYSPNSRCVQFDDVKTMKKDELREIFTGMEVVYIYHNQIDARGDKSNTEDEVFTACEEAVEEIFALIKRLSVSANTNHFIVTADHGFIYKRDKLQESDKIAYVTGLEALINRRFIISGQAVVGDGIASLTVGSILNNSDSKVISFPVSSNVFKVAGGGQNYVHGGSSPQEMLVPVINVKTKKGHMETRPVLIMLVSVVPKITNLISTLDFMQAEPVSDVIKATSYRVFFISEDNEKISNECIYVADKRDVDPQKRIFRLRFNFKNKQYDKNKKYYLVAYDEKNDLEVFRHGVVMDIAFANDFGFNV
ncbi:BREX-1 system phosphatase PglZ type A [Desulfoscipio gibsoniae]|uniref:TIGR02687 family protein n=1 Tax=Desulfoscipio gibsoniae DSM 7213 TaxID=767817 RepID=R4KDS2_9FIRM|nr:BREX-1 system phosphatase PglZ type A [Desulfoscipio gibsoniae]AGL00734.1 TIGR02687 family protein [Desulfoscipio gibsoniae DSM 7213]